MTDTAQRTLSQGGMTPEVAHVAPSDVLTPADRYQELFVAVQTQRIFPDSKTFVDCVPRLAPEEVLRRYRDDAGRPGFDLSAFVSGHFTMERIPDSHYVSDPGQGLVAHIDGLWDVLTRLPQAHPADSSLLPLPQPYVVPGGRFHELYYWDSYFTMLGLAQSGRHDLLVNMANNFSFLIDTYGHVPNGNRTYYLSRSQPAMYGLMIELFESHGVARAVRYLPHLRREYAYWMEGEDSLATGDAFRHLVRLPDGALLNRYWDERDTPREEGYLEDVNTALHAPARNAGEVYRDLRAGAASGWDFSSRWLGDANDLSTIRTTAILPVDLNSFLFATERQIARLSEAAGDTEQAQAFAARADARRQAMTRYLWSEDDGAFMDYDWQLGEIRRQMTAAIAAPLFVGMASHEEAHRTARAMADRLIAAGGLRTSEASMQTSSLQQWDPPNGWAPLQWIAIHGLRKYGENRLATDIAHRWLATVGALYTRESKLVEKYSLHTSDAMCACGGGGGEYPLQDGFGWTNGVVRRLLGDHPEHHAHTALARGRPRG
ncbi:alpha,alpha-trehalase [Pandoraea iniqua]|uniref:Putative periplasmic trehalase n=1 Tax=Pandoraea iniqua TaxID=2508288 RepID=A0A5E4W8Y5_9BURK|nr:alpha,alpha-trehalase TreF [Pandoraea iniqua]VVE20074.1 alpha,alpha-trehalase [Pandoraea iniqua]